jgi:hypothetical protein
MKIEIGESLVYSFLKHVKNCVIVQMNWKTSGNWDIPEGKKKAIEEFKKIKKHQTFSNILPRDFEQTIKQAEIDVLGIGQDNCIYAFEVAFHENGLQYGKKGVTRDRVFKKLLRTFIILKYYFPKYKHYIAFCSPKVNPMPENYISEYFEILKKDFQSEDITFHYFSNQQFNDEIVQKTLVKTTSEADSSELFVRSEKLLRLANKFPPIAPTSDIKENTEKDNSKQDETSAEDKKMKKENHKWTKSDDIIVFYLYRYGECDEIRIDTLEKYMGRYDKRGSIKMRISNFEALDTDGAKGLDKWAELSLQVYSEYKEKSQDHHKKECLEILQGK